MTDLNKKHIAPEGATHTDDNFFYRLAKGELIALGVHANTWECYINNKWVRCDSVPVRSLSDVHRIAELEKELLDWKIRHQETSTSLGEVCQRAEAAERERDYHEKTIEVFRDWFNALRDHHVSNFGSHTAEAFIGNLEVHLYWYTISELLNGGGELDTASNKFAIEQQIKALEETLRENSRSIAYPHGDNTDVIYTDDIKFDMEQLRQQLNGGEQYGDN